MTDLNMSNKNTGQSNKLEKLIYIPLRILSCDTGWVQGMSISSAGLPSVSKEQ